MRPAPSSAIASAGGLKRGEQSVSIGSMTLTADGYAVNQTGLLQEYVPPD